MGADPDGRGRRAGRRRPLRTALLLAACGALLAGCASMPDSGNLKAVDASQRPDSQSQVRVYAQPPREGARPVEIVQGFLEALTSDDPQFAMARKYLTGKASKAWNPEESTTVLADGPNTDAGNAGNDGEGSRRYTLTGRQVARVDKQHAYRPEDASYSQSVHLSQVGGPNGKEWRIDQPPPGVVLGESDFQRIYRSVNKYYFAAPTGAGVSGGTGLVADPVYIRQRIDPLTQTVKTLLEGPTNWLRPVVRSSFTSGTRLKDPDKPLTLDDQNRLTVQLNSRSDGDGQTKCKRMAAQMLFTLQDLTPSGVEQVTLERSNGSMLCVLSQERAETVAAYRSLDRPVYQYFVDEKHRLVRMSANASTVDPEPVTGVLGTGEQPLLSAAVSRDEKRAAGVSLDGKSLYTGSLLTDDSLTKTQVRSKAKTEGQRLSAPSWDGRGNLWVADRDPKRPRLLWLERGEGEPVEVEVPALDGRVEAVRVSADGVRIALLVEKKGKTSLWIGRAEKSAGKGERPEISVLDPTPAAPQMEEVTAMSWAGGGRLVVVGRETGGVQQLRYVQCDGSVLPGTALPGLTGVMEIAASEDERQPLVAHSDDGIVRLPTGSQWKTVVKEGQGPIYPG
ncbi:LpqB family beta-propeller domain-containing protein [Streptomyces silaceus]|uniref:LpqB family beta-propeller domain-containing protein n=1 Tax=Streptomyces TaxID=1883 RepID=UPI000A685C0D